MDPLRIVEITLVISLLGNFAQWMALNFYKGYYDQKQHNRKLMEGLK